MELQVGELFANRYKIEAVAGTGGMGTVYRVTDTMLEGEQVALKILKTSADESDREIKRFLREARLTRKITHPNVVRTYEVGWEGSEIYFTMEYIEGSALRELLNEEPLAVDIACGIIKQICEGLTEIHRCGVIHRDLTPGNVMIVSGGKVKITDFGVARPYFSELTAQHEVVGSSPYMSPEAWIGKGIGIPSDIYSLGVLTYELITGVRPFEATTAAEFMYKHLDAAVVSPADIEQSIPFWLEELVLRMLNKPPTDRPASAAEVLAVLDKHWGNWDRDAGISNANAAVRAVNDHKLCDQLGYHSSAEIRPSSEASLSFLYDTSEFTSPEEAFDHTSPEYDSTENELELPPVTLLSTSTLHGQLRATEINKPHRTLLNSLIITIVVAGLLLGPATILTRLVPISVLNFGESTVLGFAANSLVLFHYGAIAALPILWILLLRGTIKQAINRWLYSSTLLAFITFILILSFMVTAGLSRKLQDDPGIALRYAMQQMPHFSAAASQNTIEAALLIPIGSIYNRNVDRDVFGLTPATTLELTRLLPYLLCLLAYLTIVRQSTTPICGSHKHSPGIERPALIITASLITLQLLILPAILPTEVTTAQPFATLPIGRFTIEFRAYTLICGLLNLGVLLGLLSWRRPKAKTPSTS